VRRNAGLTVDPSPDNLDQDYEKLLTARNQAGVLSQMRDSKIMSLATYASQRMQNEIQEANNEVEETLKVGQTKISLKLVLGPTKGGARLSHGPRNRCLAREQGEVPLRDVDGLGSPRRRDQRGDSVPGHQLVPGPSGRLGHPEGCGWRGVEGDIFAYETRDPLATCSIVYECSKHCRKITHVKKVTKMQMGTMPRGFWTVHRGGL